MESLVSLAVIDHIVRFLPFLSVLFLLCAIALLRVWRCKDAAPGVKIIWTLMILGVPLVGAVCALAFARLPQAHGESVPPLRSYGLLSSWKSGWK
ncbi:MAG: hypothetical protein H3C49_00875 [Alphaproteobacteria bacterium]|nr:hypothetical protein [Alphaproteobacteria bacterium]